jgi:hypothetical protein
MDDTAIVSDNVEIFQSIKGPATALSWGSAIAGALTATAIGSILLAFGTGIGLAVASPYASTPSAGTMTIAGAVWLVLTQSIGFAAGGFLSARTRRPAGGAFSPAEIRFNDGANGFLAWAIGALAFALLLVAASAATVMAGSRAGAAVATQIAQQTPSDQLGYYVDSLLRTPQGHQTATTDQDRAQVTRVLATAIRDGRLSDEDRSYLAGLVAARSGLSQEEAQTRVQNIVNQTRDTLKQVADTTRRAAEYVAFWTFMSLLFGAVCATLGGLLGGELRDESARASS